MLHFLLLAQDEALRAAVQALRLVPSSDSSSSSSSSSAKASAVQHKSLVTSDATDAEARDGVSCVATRLIVQATATAASAASASAAGSTSQGGDALASAGCDDEEVLVEDASSEWERYCAIALDAEPSGDDIDQDVAVLQSTSSSGAARSSSKQSAFHAFHSTAAPSLSTTLAALDDSALLDDDECQL